MRVRLAFTAAVLAIMLLASGSVAYAGTENLPTAWHWAYASAMYDANGVSANRTLVLDPTGQRQGFVLKMDFAQWDWGLMVSNGPAMFHIDQGKDYTFLFDVYAPLGCRGEVDVKILCCNDPFCQNMRPDCNEHVVVVGDGQWHTVPAHFENACCPDGDYFLLLQDQANAGCWLLGDIRQTSGMGHFTK